MPSYRFAFGGPQALRVQARKPLPPCNAFVLKPTGDLGAPIQLKAGTFAVGADSAADITIDVEYVSGTHAQLQVDDAGVTVTDLSSTNGTFVDGNKIEAKKGVQVKAGSRIAFGAGTLASFELVEEAEPEAPSTADAATSPAPAEAQKSNA